MTSRSSRSVTPSRRYGDIIGSIFSNGSGDLEEKKNTSVSQVKRLFRERRQKNSTRSRNSTPEKRQTPSSPVRGRYNEERTSSRPPTPDRPRNGSRPPTPDRNRNTTGSGSVSEGISVRSLSISPTKKRDHGVNSSGSVVSLTTRVVKQLHKEMEKTNEREQKVLGRTTSEPLKKEPGKKETQQKTTEISLTQSHEQPGLSLKVDSAKTEPEAGVTPGDSTQTKETIQAQNEQIKFYETCLQRQSNYIEQLELELKLSKKNELKLDLELEIHDLKYSMYDDYRRMMDKKRLDTTYDKEGDEIEREFESSLFLKSSDAFEKLNHLDQLYEKSKLEAESRFSILQEKYNRIKSTRSMLDGELSKDTSNTASLDTTALDLHKRIKILEAENSKYGLDRKRMNEELEKAKSAQNDSTSRDEANHNRTQDLEKQTLKNKIIALETEIGFTSGHIDDKTRTRRYRALEKNLNDYVAEIMGLEDQLKAKEKMISKLKERKITMGFESEKPNGLDWHSSVQSRKWYEQSNNGQKGPTMSSKTPEDRLHRSGDECESATKCPQPNTKKGGEVIESSTDTLELKDSLSKTIGSKKIGSRKSIIRRGQPSSSARIQMLRKRLDALANDHSSVGTDNSQLSRKTAP